MPDAVERESKKALDPSDLAEKDPWISRMGRRAKGGFKIIWSSKIASVGLSIVLFWVLAAIFAPLLTPYTPTAQDWMAPNQGPTLKHPLGHR